MGPLYSVKKGFELFAPIGPTVSSLLTNAHESAKSSIAFISCLALCRVGLQPIGKGILHDQSNSVVFARFEVLVEDSVVGTDHLAERSGLR